MVSFFDIDNVLAILNHPLYILSIVYLKLTQNFGIGLLYISDFTLTGRRWYFKGERGLSGWGWMGRAGEVRTFPSLILIDQSSMYRLVSRRIKVSPPLKTERNLKFQRQYYYYFALFLFLFLIQSLAFHKEEQSRSSRPLHFFIIKQK